MPKACQLLIFTWPINVPTCQMACQFPFWHANVPKGVPIFQTFFLQNAKGNFYNLLLHEKVYIILDIIVMHMIVYVSYIKTALYFISILHVILKKSVEFSKLFCSLDENENTKRPGFYTLLVTRVFSNFLQLKQLNKTNNAFEYCDLLELWSAWIGDPG